MQNLSNIAKNVLFYGKFVVARLLIFGSVGTILSWILGFLIGPQLIQTMDFSSGKAVHGGIELLPLALLFILIQNWYQCLLLLLYAVIFPVLSFLMGKSNGTKLALFHLWQNNQKLLADYLGEYFLVYLSRNHAEVLVKGILTGSDYIVLLETYLEKLRGIPFFLKGIVRGYLQKVQLVKACKAAIHADKQTLSPERFQQILLEAATSKANEHIEKPTWTMLFVIVGCEIALFVGLKVWLG